MMQKNTISFVKEEMKAGDSDKNQSESDSLSSCDDGDKGLISIQ